MVITHDYQVHQLLGSPQNEDYPWLTPKMELVRKYKEIPLSTCLADLASAPATDIATVEIRIELERLCDQAKLTYQERICLLRSQEDSLECIAEYLNCGVKTVRRRLITAYRKMAEVVSQNDDYQGF